MLEGLDKIDWDSLQAPEIPRLLKAAASKGDEQARLGAIFGLEDYLVPWELMEGYAWEKQWNQLHQLVEYNIPPLVIPFLIEILKKSSASREKVGLLEILYDLCRYKKMADSYNTPSWIEFGNKLRVWGTEIREKVRTGVEIYKTLLFDEEGDVRTMANEVLWILGDPNFIEAWSNRHEPYI